jgi:hypothetical protein
MTRFFRFCSFAVLTQLVLLLNQIVLLPIQLRIWGTVTTASWYAAIALAAITTVADLGLRTAGHVELLQFVNDKDELAGLHIKQIWGWIRLLVCLITILLLGGGFIESLLHGGGQQTIWKSALTLAYAIETLLIIRIGFLDSLGHYSGAESTYFVFAMLRLTLALPGLLLLRLQPWGLAGVFLITSAVGITLQGRLCKRLGVLGLLDPLPQKLSLRVIAIVRYTIAEPLSTWLRISLPVLVIASISTPAAVTTYVALRAVFGASRTTIQQLARVASVEYLRLSISGRVKTAELILTGFVQCAGFLGAVMAGFVVVDNLRVLGLWLTHFDRDLFQIVVASFAASGAFYAYQIFVSLTYRIGDLAEGAHRQYAFVLYSGGFSVIALSLKSLSWYLCLIVVSEIALSTSFMLRRRGDTNPNGWQAGPRGLLASTGGLAMLAILWLTVRRDHSGIFVSVSSAGFEDSLATLSVGLVTLAIFQALLNRDLIKKLIYISLPRLFMAKAVKS